MIFKVDILFKSSTYGNRISPTQFTEETVLSSGNNFSIIVKDKLLAGGWIQLWSFNAFQYKTRIVLYMTPGCFVYNTPVVFLNWIVWCLQLCFFNNTFHSCLHFHINFSIVYFLDLEKWPWNFDWNALNPYIILSSLGILMVSIPPFHEHGQFFHFVCVCLHFFVQ